MICWWLAKAKLNTEFEMNDLGLASRVFIMKINRDRKNKRLLLSQPTYVGKLLEKSTMTFAKPAGIPLAQHFKLSASNSPITDEELESMNNITYANAVGYI